MHSEDTKSIDSTTSIEINNYEYSNLYKISVMDVPGFYEVTDFSKRDIEFIRNCSTFIYVVDNKSENISEIEKQLTSYFKYIISVNPDANFNIFFHQTDYETFNKVKETIEIKNLIQKLSDHSNSEANNEKKRFVKNKITSQCTSIYDHSIYEGISRIISKLIISKCPQIQYMLNEICYVL